MDTSIITPSVHTSATKIEGCTSVSTEPKKGVERAGIQRRCTTCGLEPTALARAGLTSTLLQQTGTRLKGLEQSRRSASCSQIEASDFAERNRMSHEMWEARYAAAEGQLFGSAPNAFLARHAAEIAPGSRVLVPADGDGRNGVWLAEQGHHVLATEFSHAAQTKARAVAAQKGVSLDFVLGDLTDYAWPEARFDAIAAIFIQFLTPPEREIVFEGIARALKPGGVLLLEGYRPEQLAYGTGGPKIVENLYTEPMLQAAFGHFAQCRIEAYDAHLEEGAGHHGMSALIDVIARR
jgi:SAM-dependent methyltransferase